MPIHTLKNKNIISAMKTGFVGLGVMGQGMTRQLASAGYLTGVYNRTPGRATALNVTEYPTIQALAADVDLLFICVSADNDVLQVVEAIAETIKPGSIVMDMSTVSRDTAIQAAALLHAKQVEFLDAPVSGGAEGASKGTLVMMVGGKAGVLAKITPMLEAMTSRIEHMGDVGQGQACKAVNQILAAGINQAVTQALAFADRQGLPLESVIDTLSGGAAGNWFLQHRGKTMTQGQFKPGFKLALHHKDLLICQKMAQQSAIASPLVDTTLDEYSQLIAQGFGDEDISALYRLKRKQ